MIHVPVGVIPQDDYCEMGQDAEGNQNQSADMSGENYEVMSAEETDGELAAGENYMAMEDEAPPQEDYEEPQQEKTEDEDYEITESTKQTPPSQDEEYVLPDADSDYEGIKQQQPFFPIQLNLKLILIVNPQSPKVWWNAESVLVVTSLKVNY